MRRGSRRAQEAKVALLHSVLGETRVARGAEQPIIAVSLEAQPIKPARQQFGFFETALRDPNQLYETLARLTALLGTDRVGTPVLEETYRPDAFRLEPFAWKLNDDHPHRLAAASPPLPNPLLCPHWRFASVSPKGREGEGRVRVALCSDLPRIALRRFRSNLSAAVLLDKDKPAHIRSARIEGEICSRKGPYATSGNWWDEAAWGRVEWDVQLENGVVARCHEVTGTWKLDGIYD
jgi:protein ImuB